MFLTQLEQIFKRKLLKEDFKTLSSSIGLDETTQKDFQDHLSATIDNIVLSLLNSQYAPIPLKQLEIPKPNKKEKRQIAISSIKDKLIQKRLYNAIYDYFDALFSDKSYAYRKSKSTTKAINRTSDFLNKGYTYILKSDIDDFFDNINHIKLITLLQNHIQDKRILHLISLFIKNGAFANQDYKDHQKGIHQGDILSPLLSNIYLNQFDRFLESHHLEHIRYADDFVIFFKSQEEAKETLSLINNYLITLDLKLNQDKTHITHISEGFTFLGIDFQGKSKTINPTNLEKIIAKIHTLAQNKSGFKKYILELNTYLLSLKNYYLKFIKPHSNAHEQIKQHLIQSLANKIYLAKTNKKINTKREFKILLHQINFDILFLDQDIKTLIDAIITKAYEIYLSQKSYKTDEKKITQQKNIFAKKFSNISTLHLMRPGLIIGISKNTFTLKEQGKVIKKIPKDTLKRIIIEAKGISLSSNVIKKCATLQIPIDFIDKKGQYFAQLTTYKATITQMIYKQAKLINTPIQLALAKEFIRAKSKNQLNYIKYLNKYHKNLDSNITKIAKSQKIIKNAKTIDELRGYEGEISAIYWDSLKLISKTPFSNRITFGAKDIVNSSLNYAYAILYSRVQHFLIQAGLSLNISFLHSLDNTKPTLVFDMIEEFRTFIVDRTIISMLNKDESITLDNEGLLTKSSRQKIAQHIKEKLGSYTMWKKESIKCDNIIETQCYQLANVINKKKEKYKGFIGKY